MTDKLDQTTQAIKDTLGVTYTVREVRGFLAQLEDLIKSQAPYFDAQLLHRRERLERALGINAKQPTN